MSETQEKICLFTAMFWLGCSSGHACHCDWFGTGFFALSACLAFLLVYLAGRGRTGL